MDYRTAEKFKLKMGNNDDTVSKGLRNMLFKKMGLKDKKEFYTFILEQTEAIRKKIYDKIGVTRKQSFSNIMLKEIQMEKE